MFVGREKERAVLERLYKKDTFECVVMYGRKHVGKTTLINKFIRDKRAIYFSGIESTEQQNLVMFGRSIMAAKGVYADCSFATWMDALEEILKMARDERLVLVMDGFDHLASSFPGIISLLSGWLEHFFLETKLFLILCGSSLSFMEEQVIDFQSPFYGIWTAQMKVLPFTFAECVSYYAHFSKEDLAAAYGITGGIPLYLSKLDDTEAIADNIIRNFFKPGTYLFEEPEKLLRQECRELRQYNAVIAAIANGAFRMSEIIAKAGMKDTATTAMYINKLLSLGIVERQTPYGEDMSSHRRMYRLTDGMFWFWYRFVPQNMAYIQQGLGGQLYEHIKEQIPAYMELVFHEICRQYLWQENAANRLPIEFEDIGRWWGYNAEKKCEEEIDLLGDNGNGEAIFATCKWQDEDLDDSELRCLAERTKLFSYQRNVLVLFSKTGFTGRCRRLAGRIGNVLLISFLDMNWER